jgi:hypothetical protein
MFKEATLFRELNESVQTLVQEEINETTQQKEKKYYVEGVFIECEVKNRNGRFYRKEWIKPEVERYINECVNAGRGVGQLCHPDTAQIQIDKISHRIVSLKEDGNNWIGKALILDTTDGRNVKALIDGGVKFGQSTRALGSLAEENGMKIVQKDYQLVTAADLVWDPSAPNAFATAIMEESKWLFDGKNWKIAEQIRQEIKKTPARRLNESLFLKKFEEFLRKIH